jgi:hypothetical protein
MTRGRDTAVVTGGRRVAGLVPHINREALHHGAEIACCATSTPTADRTSAPGG